MPASHAITTTLIDGVALATATNAVTASHAAWLMEKGVTPHLAIILVGDHEPSKIYVASKQKKAKSLGITATLHKLPADVPQAALLAALHDLSNDADTHGIIVQMPLPAHIDESAVLDAVSPEKDVDGLTTVNLGRLVTGQPSFVPCTPQGCMLLIKSVRQNLTGLHAVVVGRSRLVGKPLADLLLQQNCSVTTIHSKTEQPALLARQADILCVAAGKTGLVTADWVKPGAIVIDVGINRTDGGLAGDVDFAGVAPLAGAITPVPKGVGPMTIACLLRNTIYAAAKQYKLVLPDTAA